MNQRNTLKTLKFIAGVIFTWLTLTMSTSSAQAGTKVYSLDNIFLDGNPTQQMTGAFEWNYQHGNFENGTGIFTELFIPWYGTDIEALTINFDIGKSIEFSLTGNIDNQGLNLTLFLQQPLSSSQSTLIDLDRSSFEIERGGHRGGFVSGSISPNLVPIPAAAWLFGTSLLGLLSVVRRKKA
jgi:hypothetical protein